MPATTTTTTTAAVATNGHASTKLNGLSLSADAATPTEQGQSLRAVLHGAKDLRIEHAPIEPPAAGEVQLKILQTGLCGSDLHYYLHGRNGSFALQHPMCLGHESAGVVVAVGPGVAGSSILPPLAVGDRVALEAGQYCTTCSFCQAGRYNLCPSMRFASSAKTAPHLHGTMQERMNWPARLCHRLPPNVSLTSAALIEPLSVVLQSLTRSRFTAGESCLVLGAGAVGLLACAAAKASGASYVVAADIDEGKLAFAKDNGWADATHLIPRGSTPPPPASTRAEQDEADVASAQATSTALLSAVSRQQGFDAVFECTGVPSCVRTSIFATSPGGRVVLIGMGHPVQTLPIGAAALREVDILGVFRYANSYPKAIAMLSGGSLRASGGGRPADGSDVDSREGDASGKRMGGIENLVSHRYRLAQADEAFETMLRGKGHEGRGVVKVFISEE